MTIYVQVCRLCVNCMYEYMRSICGRLHLLHSMTKHVRVSLSGLLLYFSDGLLPLLKSFYEAIFNLPTSSFSQDGRMQISGDILSALLVGSACTSRRTH